MADVAQGFPTKNFFINMLTRDIALNDAILDLLDNCLDGVIRMKGTEGKKTNDRYYEGFHAKITISKDSFKIEDNCGGIPRSVAEKYAFRMGRETSKTSEGLPTVGIYGIGMKRAIFKIGKEASVTSRHEEGSFVVKIPEDWIDRKDDWNFPISNITNDTSKEKGTYIVITNLAGDVAFQWKTEDHLKFFIDTLVMTIKTSYSLIIEKGFRISVNEKPVDALPVQLLVSKEQGEGIRPYLYKRDYGSVSVNLAVGFYAPPPTPDEIDESAESKRLSSDAGWTIVCNDRIILFNDKTHLTGWGDAGIPQYHTQFIGIRGIVIFESNNPEELPMTTTKRGIDLSSSIYADIKNKMRDGLKMLTSYTNRWKGRNEQERIYFEKADSIPYSKLFKDNELKKLDVTFEFRNKDDGSVYVPDLPKPPNDKDYEIIRFVKPKDEIKTVCGILYDDPLINRKPSKVGEDCFNSVLKNADSQTK